MLLESPGVVPDAQPSLHSLGVAMSTSKGGLEIAEFCQQAHSKTLAQRFVNLTETVPFWTACSANEWMDKFNGERAGRAGWVKAEAQFGVGARGGRWALGGDEFSGRLAGRAPA